MLKARRVAGTVLMVVICFSLAACHSAKGPGDGLVHVVLQTDWYPQPEMGGFYEAQLTGLYKAAGLDVEIRPGGPAIVAGQQVASGAAQFGMGSSDSVLVDNARGIPEVAVGATMQQDPQAVMVHTESPVKTFADLNGHTVAVKPGSIWFQYLVKRYKLDNVRETPATYSVANFINDPGYIQQAFVTSEPFFARQKGAQVRTLLISSTEYQPYRVFFTSRGYVATHPEIVEKFVQASIEGWRRYLADPTEVDAALHQLNRAMSPEQTQFSFETLKTGHFIDGTNTPESHLGHFTPERWATTYQQLVDLKVIPKAFDPTTAYTTRFTP